MQVLTRHRAVVTLPGGRARTSTSGQVERGTVVAVRRTRALARWRCTLTITQSVLTTPARTAATLGARRSPRVQLLSLATRRRVVAHEQHERGGWFPGSKQWIAEVIGARDVPSDGLDDDLVVTAAASLALSRLVLEVFLLVVPELNAGTHVQTSARDHVHVLYKQPLQCSYLATTDMRRKLGSSAPCFGKRS